ncbi:MAG: transglycosylase domain-containing protein [Acidimicrobiales bacterium]
MTDRRRGATARQRGKGRPAPKAKPGAKRRSFLWRWRRALFLAGLLLVAGVAGLGYALAQIELPPERINAQTSYICAGDVRSNCTEQNALAKLAGDQDRTNVRLADVPQVMLDAVLAAEDRDFFKHGGVDPLGVARAFWADVRNSGSTQGGSTITQQYVKKAYLSDERSFTRKVKEAVLAIKVENELTKQQILERYLNTVYFGRGAYGVGAAARAYCDYDLTSGTLSEAAYLAGLIRSPETADAVSDPATAKFRRHTVLANMLDAKMIASGAYAAADSVPFVVASAPGAADGFVQPRTPRNNIDVKQGADVGSDYFVAYVRQQLRDHGFSDAEIYGGGLRVYTTLNLDAQRAAWDAVHSTLDQPDDPQSGVVTLDPDGHVIAMYGGSDFGASQVNRAVGAAGGGSGRQPGSSFKPFVLAEAVVQGISLQSVFNAPSKIVIPHANAGGPWEVDNAEPSSGVLNLIDATRESSNTVFAQLMVKVKPENVIPLAHAMGIKAELQEVNSLVLGTSEVSPLDMASGYSTFAHRGSHIEPTAILRVERPDGSVVTFDQARSTPLTENQSDLVTYALRQVILGGTGTGANFGKEAAGKTGTAEENQDAWFVGFTPNGYTTAVWVGYDTPTPMKSVHGLTVFGGTFPATIWRKTMANVLDGIAVGSFTNPGSFPGKALNPELTTVPSTAKPASTTTTAGPAPTTTAAPVATTTTTAPAPTTTSSSTTIPPAPPLPPEPN